MNLNPEIVYQFTGKELQVALENVKLLDMTQSQFELHKTDRIKAICTALAAYPDPKLFEMLRNAIEQQYTPQRFGDKP